MRGGFGPCFRIDERAGLRGADGLARARLGKHDVPEVVLGSSEADAHKAVLLLLADAGDEAFDGFVGHLIENTDHLAWQERGVHDNQSAVGADVLGVGLEVNGFAFRHVATHLQRDLKGDPDGATPFWVPCSMHAAAWMGTTREHAILQDE